MENLTAPTAGTYQSIKDIVKNSLENSQYKQIYDALESARTWHEKINQYTQPGEYQKALRDSLASMRIRLDEIRQNVSGGQSETMAHIAAILDSMESGVLDTDEEIDVTDCLDTMLDGIEAAKLRMTEEQRIAYEDFTTVIKNGHAFLTIDRFILIAQLLFALLFGIWGSIDSKKQAELLEIIASNAQTQTELDEKLLNAQARIVETLDTLGDKLDALNNGLLESYENAVEEHIEAEHDEQE